MREQKSLDDFRSQLDQLDTQIVSLLARRFDVCRDVARYKRQQGIPMMQPARVQIVKQRAAERARLAGVNEEFIVALYTAIIAEACRLEDDIIQSPEIQSPDFQSAHIQSADETVLVEQAAPLFPSSVESGQGAVRQ